MKAFLSHSSLDKDFVRSVAKYLGRQYCVFDEQAFATGEEFKTSIEHAFDESSVFILFASRNSLDSIWVNFEIEEAWYRKLHHNVSKSLVYLIDSSVDVKKLPSWLQRALIRREISPKPLARDIRHHLDDLLRERQHIHFVGRSHKVEELESSLTPTDGSHPPHALFVTGLPGIGRRSLVKRTCPGILNLRKYVEIRVGESDSINDICVGVADHVEPYSTREGFERIVQNIRNLSDKEAIQRTLTNLRSMVETGELPIFFDEGGLLDTEGYIQETVKAIFRELGPDDEAYIFFISTRKPHKEIGTSLPVVKVDPLQVNETKRLISLLSKQANLKIMPNQIAEIAEYVAGYPPSAYFAIQQAKDYGVDALIRDKTRLVEFQTTVFLRHFSTLNLNDKEKDLLRLLATYSPLPLPIIGKILSISLPNLVDMLVRLIDLALVITTNEGYYRIADPVAHAAVTAYRFPSDEQHKKVARLLTVFLEEAEIEGPMLELSRVVFRAALWAKDKEAAQKAIHLSNDLIRITEAHYHARKFKDAISHGQVAIKERPESITARSFLIRALIQEEKYREAESQISELKRYAPLGEVNFIKGFLERRRGKFQAAIQVYKEAENLGKLGVAISRELAFCYHMVGDQEKAIMYAEAALKRHGDNPYVVDLWAQIATKRKDEATARKALGRLEIINKSLFYYHRLSRVELAFGNLNEARAAAKEAVDFDDSPPFEVIAQLVSCEIELGNFADATELLVRLDSQYGNIRRDIRIALRCRLENALGHYKDALSLCEQINDQNTVFCKRIKQHALLGELKASALEDSIRADYEKQLSKLEVELADIRTDQFDSYELDTSLTF